jgi:hypothetical protein
MKPSEEKQNDQRLSNKYRPEMKELDQILGELYEHIPKETESPLKAGSEGSKLLSRFDDRLKRSRREFDAMLFFTVCFGILKSGKSTLVNLLAGHEEASPTRFGQDTTIRPCLLMAAKADEDEEIIIFRMKDTALAEGAEDKEQKCFNAVIDHLRGVIADEQELSNHQVIIRRERFTKDNVFKAVCDKEGFGNEPLITAIRLKTCSDLLRSDIALLDVPGLDSDKMDTEIPRYLELLDRCDLLLFVQSTISAFGKGAGSMLKSLVRRSKGSPVWLIQNRFEAQPWRRQEDLRDRDLDLSRVSRKNLAISLSIPENLIFSKQINLGKAYDARFNESLLLPGIESNRLMEESAFPEVEKELSDKINNERLDIQLANCLNQLLNSVKDGRGDLRQLEEWISSEKARLFQFQSAFDKLIHRFEGKAEFIPVPQNDDGSSQLTSLAKGVISTHSDQWKDKVRMDMDHWKSQIQEKWVGDEFNTEMNKRVRELFDLGPCSHFSLSSSFGSSLGDIFRRIVETSNKYRDLIEESQKTLADFEVPLIEAQTLEWNHGDSPIYLEVSTTPPEQVKGGRAWYGPKHKIDVITCRHKIDQAVSVLDEAIDRYTRKIMGGELDKWFRNYRDGQISDHFCKQLRKRKSDKEEEAKKRQAELTQIAETIPALREHSDRLGDFANRFRKKYNLI